MAMNPRLFNSGSQAVEPDGIQGLRAMMIFNGRTSVFPPAHNLAGVWSRAGGDFTFVNMAADCDQEGTLIGHGRLISLKASPSFLPGIILRYPVAFLIFFWRLRQLVRKLKPEVLLGCWGGGYLLARMLRWSGVRVRVVFWAQEYIRHDELSRREPLRYLVWMERRLARSADLTVVADPIRGKYQCAYLGTTNWMAIRNVPAREDFAEGPSQFADFLKAVKSAHPDEVVFAFVGSICTGALVPQLIDSFEQWPQGTQLVFVGSVDPDLPDFHERIKKHQGRIHYLPRMPYDQIMRGLKLADVGIAFYNVDQPWVNERYCAPCKVGDYLKLALPMLLSSNETLSGLVREYPVGVTVDPRSPKDIARGVVRLLEAIEKSEVEKSVIRSAFLNGLCLEAQCEPLFRLIHDWCRQKNSQVNGL